MLFAKLDLENSGREIEKDGNDGQITENVINNGDDQVVVPAT